jgi:hypothetical protein
MKFNWSNIIYNFILAIFIASISISMIIKYAAGASNWLSESAKILFAEHLLIVLLVLLLLVFILLQLLSENTLYTKTWCKSIEYLEHDEKIYLLLIFLLSIIGFYLRLTHLNYQSFWIDETISSDAAVSILKNGIPIFPSGMIYDRSILNTMFIASSFGVFGISEFAGRLPSVIFGTLSIPVTYLLGKKLGNKNIGLAAALFMAFSLLDITWARQARMYAQLQFFVVLSFYLFWVVVEEKKIKYIPLFLISILAAFLSHESGVFLILVFLLYIFLINMKNVFVWCREFLKDAKTHSIYVVIGVLLLILLFKILYDVLPDLFPLLKVEPIYNDFYVTFLVYSYQILLYLYILGIIVFISSENNNLKILLLITFIPFYFFIWAPPLAGPDLTRAYNSRYILWYIPFFYIISAYSIQWIIKNIFGKTIFRSAINFVFIFIVILLIILLPLAFTTSPKAIYGFYENIQNLHQPDIRTAFTYVKNQMNTDDIIISDTTGTSEAMYYLGDKFLSDRNYDLYEKKLLFERDGRRYDIYGNASIIENLTMLKDIVRTNKRGWLITQGGIGKTGETIDFIRSNMYKHLTTSENFNSSYLSLPGKIRQIDVYSWGIVTRQDYSDNFDTDKWNDDKYFSYGIDRSKGIIHTKYVLYPIIKDEETKVKYSFNFSGDLQVVMIDVNGTRRDTEHSLSIWASPDDKIYTKIIEFDKPMDIIKEADIINYIKDNQTWIEFRFFRSSKGDNTPRILDFSISADSKDNETVEITPFRKEGQAVSVVNDSRYSPTNLIKEPSFEHYKDSDKPPIAWSFTSNNGAQASIDTSASNGNYSFQISARNSTSGNADLSQLIMINEGKYLFNLSYKQVGNGNTSALLQWMDAQGKETGNERLGLYPNMSWTIFSFEKYIQANTTQGKVILRYQTQKGDSGTVWFDDVRLYSAGED